MSSCLKYAIFIAKILSMSNIPGPPRHFLRILSKRYDVTWCHIIKIVMSLSQMLKAKIDYHRLFQAHCYCYNSIIDSIKNFHYILSLLILITKQSLYNWIPTITLEKPILMSHWESTKIFYIYGLFLRKLFVRIKRFLRPSHLSANLGRGV